MTIGPGKEPVAGFRDHENELWDPIKVRDFFVTSWTTIKGNF